jgi:hypothetical protein
MFSIAWASSALHSADRLKPLSGQKIRSKIIGHIVTDASHWSDDFQLDGMLKVVDLGQHKMGTWRIDNGELCLTIQERKLPTQCLEIWLSGDLVEYHRDGVVIAQGYLRNH